ncbi:MAG: glycosyltransferase family 2 protein [Candidatus Chisholmbacteria bacterium]|nr:glycosyltransferase family 2 protein [Candidatus Chisholmbacteria bacterium]
MTLSVIIPTFNEKRYIVGCLNSLLAQSLKPKEIIIVDDGSSDKTLNVLSGLRITNYELRILSQKHKGAGAARNLGASKATGNILVFVDADMDFDPNFLRSLVDPIIHRRAKGTFSKDEYVKNWSNPWAKAWNYCRGLKEHRAIPSSYPNTAPVFRAILKKEFIKVGGFDEKRGYDDDWSLSEKLGVKAVNAPNAVYYHHNPDSLTAIFIQARWQGSRKFKFGTIGKIFHLIRSLLGLGFFLSPLWVAVRFRHPPSFLAKIIFEIGFDTGIIRAAISGRTSK